MTAPEQQEIARKTWTAGDYGSMVDRIADVGTTAVDAAGVGGEDRVLDVACGTGNATIPAAERGAEVVGLDLTPKLLEEGRAAAAEAGVEIEWVEGDAEQLPFEDESFDVVLSVFGSMFAPNHEVAASEIARVMRSGGRLAVCSWTPDGNTGRFFATIGSHMPPPPEGFQPPVLWGTEEHIRSLFDGSGVELGFKAAEIEWRFDSAEAAIEELSTKLGPLVLARAALEPEGKWQALHDDIKALMGEVNTSDQGDLRYAGQYLVATGRKG